MKLGYDLTIEQSQKLMMTPELIQAIQILQMNSHELEEHVQNEMLENPLLELDQKNIRNGRESDALKREQPQKNEAEQDEIDLREKIVESEYDDISYRQWEHRANDEDSLTFDQYTSKEETLQDYLLLQLTFSDLEGYEKKIGRFIVENIDDNGYLTVDNSEICNAFKIDNDKAEKIIEIIQGFEPVGVGSRSLEECLIIQLSAKGLLEDSIEYIILHHLKDIGENRLQNVSKQTGLTVPEVQMIGDLIRTLEPKPGRKYSSGEDIRYIVPDIIVEKQDDGFTVYSNDNSIPHLMVSAYYVNLAKTHKEDEEVQKYLTDKYNSALWLIRSIQQRKQTIYNVACAVVDYQMDFLENGDKHMKTMTLKQIADIVGVHESTVSRSTNGKYIQTPRGVYELKYFFSSGVTNSDGAGLSSNSIKTFIKEIIDNEDNKKPYSDQELVRILSEKGIEISRRTVAKYRESMEILSSSKRRRF